MLFCEDCANKGKGERDDMPGWYSVDEERLPVELPDIKDFRLKNEKGVPLNNAPDAWKYTECPYCGQKAERELEVSDTFLDSSWYFLGYLSMKDGVWIEDNLKSESPFDSKVLQKWMPVDAYIGGAEHAVLHLLYSRFVTMALHDMGYLEFEEPFPFLFTHGLIIKDGSKMSKSKGNVINPDEYIGKFGADVLRLYLMFLGPYEQGGDFSDTGIEGMSRFLDRVWDLFDNHLDKAFTEKNIDNELQIKMHQTIKKVTNDMSKFKYNTAIASIMEFTNLLRDLASNEGIDEAKRKNVKSPIWNKSLSVLSKMMAPFAPFFAEEIWTSKLGKTFSVHDSAWPDYKDEYTKETKVIVAVQVNGKLRTTLNLDRELATKRKELIKVAKSNKKVSKWLKKGKLKDTIFVAGKLVNFVVE
jgi:leucyl-tRNA synthetase